MNSATTMMASHNTAGHACQPIYNGDRTFTVALRPQHLAWCGIYTNIYTTIYTTINTNINTSPATRGEWHEGRMARRGSVKYHL
jgi:hypothetical protein